MLEEIQFKFLHSFVTGTYRNGASGGVQRKFMMGNMKPSNMNSTYNADPAPYVNETVNMNSAVTVNAKQSNSSRYSTITRESHATMNETVTINSKNSNPSRFSTITRPKSKLSYGAPPSQTVKGPQYASNMLRLKNSSSTESLKSNESYVISRPNGLRGPGPASSMQNKKSLHKSMGALNLNGPKAVEYAKVQSTENLSVKSGGSDSGDLVTGNIQGVPSQRPQSGLLRPGFSRIPAPGSRIPSASSR